MMGVGKVDPDKGMVESGTAQPSSLKVPHPGTRTAKGKHNCQGYFDLESDLVYWGLSPPFIRHDYIHSLVHFCLYNGHILWIKPCLIMGLG